MRQRNEMEAAVIAVQQQTTAEAAKKARLSSFCQKEF